MSRSTYALDWFDYERIEQDIPRGLETIGETRFGAIYWSIESVLRGSQALKSVAQKPEYAIDEDSVSTYYISLASI